MSLLDLQQIPTDKDSFNNEQYALLEKYIVDGHQHVDMLRDGRLVSIDEVPPETVLDIGVIAIWRKSLADITGLQTILYIESEGHRQPVGNNSCDTTCCEAVEKSLEQANRVNIAHSGICTGCGLPIWISPILLKHETKQAVIGWLVGHGLTAPVEPMQKMVDLVAGNAGNCASEEYSKSVFAALQKRHTQTLLDSAENDRKMMLESEITANELAKAKEELQEALKKADLASKTKSMFLAAMSHEIRTPLTCVVGFADLLSMPNIDAERKADFARNIKDSGQILLSLINNVLDLSKIEAGRIELENIDYEIRHLLSEIESIFSMTASEKNLELQFNVSDSVPKTQLGDPTRVRQIIMNLVGNAVKFTSTGGVTVDVAYSDRLQITVTDTGLGIPEDQLPVIFDAFSQASSETTRKYGGSGLGLAITHSLVTSMGGKISVKSMPGVGTTFELCI